jgi:hypothetical protein
VALHAAQEMRNQIVSLLLFCFLSFLPFSHPAHAADIKTDLSLSTGYRIDDLNWNIAGNISGNNPNVLSELQRSDLHIFQAALRGKALINERLYLRGT